MNQRIFKWNLCTVKKIFLSTFTADAIK